MLFRTLKKELQRFHLVSKGWDDHVTSGESWVVLDDVFGGWDSTLLSAQKSVASSNNTESSGVSYVVEDGSMSLVNNGSGDYSKSWVSSFGSGRVDVVITELFVSVFISLSELRGRWYTGLGDNSGSRYGSWDGWDSWDGGWDGSSSESWSSIGTSVSKTKSSVSVTSIGQPWISFSYD